jgi:glycosyltransferase involved in cell wall biosynthesis
MPKRVLVISGHSGEMDRRIIAEANALAESGRDVTLVSVPTTVPANCLAPSVRLVLPATATAAARPIRRAMAPARRAAGAVLSHVMPRWRERRALRTSQRYFLQQVPPGRYDAIHCHDLDTLPAAQRVRTHMAPQARLIYDAHELYPYQFDDRSFERFWSRLETRFIGSADLIITVNESIASQFERLYGVCRPTVIFNSYGNLRNPAPLPEADFFQHFGVPPGGFCILFQGSLTRFRNLPHLVRAFEGLDDGYRLFVLGAGPLEGELRRLATASRIRNVAFGAHITQAELLRYTAHADLGIIPYEDSGVLNMRYCTPNKLFEFIEAKVPICASSLPELARIVTEHGIGAAYAMNSPAEIAGAIRDCRQRCERGEFELEARERAREHFAWSEQRRRLLTLYEDLGV